MSEFLIEAEYDSDARVWFAQHDDLGLATEAENLEILQYKLQEMIPELATLNGYSGPHPIFFTMIAKRRMEAFA